MRMSLPCEICGRMTPNESPRSICPQCEEMEKKPEWTESKNLLGKRVGYLEIKAHELREGDFLDQHLGDVVISATAHSSNRIAVNYFHHMKQCTTVAWVDENKTVRIWAEWIL